MTISDPSQSPAAGGFHSQPQQAPSQSAHIPYQVPAQQYQQPVQVIAAKSTGVAVLLSFLWLGAGHLYAGSTGVGIALILLEFFVLWPLTWVFFLGVLLWLVIAPFVMISASQAAKSFNRRNGIVVR